MDGSLLAQALTRPVRRLRLKVHNIPDVVINTDASPGGMGGLLYINNSLVAAFSNKVTEEDCKQLLWRPMLCWWRCNCGCLSSQGVQSR